MMTRNHLYRYPQEGKIAGVCAGVAHYIGMEVWLVRILVLTLFLLGGTGIVLLGYVAAWLFMDKAPLLAEQVDEPQLKEKSWQAGEAPRKRVNTLTGEFDEMEARIRRLESYVTSETFKVRNKFRQL